MLERIGTIGQENHVVVGENWFSPTKKLVVVARGSSTGHFRNTNLQRAVKEKMRNETKFCLKANTIILSRVIS